MGHWKKHCVLIVGTLFTGCGVSVPAFELTAIQSSCKKDCTRLFHQLFDKIFTAEELEGAVISGKHGVVPEGKHLLDPVKVQAIQSKFTSHFWVL